MTSETSRYMSSRSSFSSETSDLEGELDKKKQRQADCIRNVANFSKVKPVHLLDKKNFNPELLEFYLEQSAPKLVALFDKIQALDQQDLKKEGKVFKHMIFTDNKSSSYGAKIIASAFITKGFQPTFHVQGPGFAVHPEEQLLKNKGRNFSLLMSKSIFERSMNVKFKKSILEMYNRRPDNVHGDLCRFIILDQGFKEGIDLFDVKYVHLFEPLVVRADEKQAIGRGTRFCGQRGLEFHPRFGWPLYVFRYEVTLPEDVQAKYQNTKQIFELYLKYANIDLRKVVFAAELEQAAIDASVDKELTRAIHQFTIERPPPILQEGGVVLRSAVPKPPTKLFNSVSSMMSHIQKGFKTFTYPKVKLENQCKDMTGGVFAKSETDGGNKGGALVQFTPTQDFIRHYFQPSSAYKGMLLWHSVGTGKTCSAIATASTSFEKEGYTILWVTRHTLKSDIWKNMFQWICSTTVQERLDNGSLKLPKVLGNPKRFAPPEWMEPISYKQFSNMLLQKNNIYSEIVRRNGKEDPLRKTLVIIDEAHKLYSPTVVGSEKPNTDILEQMVQHSYKVSGKDSVRLLVMTATPYTEDGMEMIKLMNLLRDKKDALPTEFEEFSNQYLAEDGSFKPKKLKAFQDDLSGYISYLNRSQDARNFAHPVLKDVFVPLTVEPDEEKVPVLDKEGNPKLDEEGEPLMKYPKMDGKYDKWMAEIKERMKEHKELLGEAKEAHKECKKENKGTHKKEIQTEVKEKIQALKEKEKTALEECKQKPVKERKECRDQVKAEFKGKIQEVKDSKATLIESKKKNCDEFTKKIDQHQEDISLLKEEQLQVKEYMRQISDKMKALREESKGLNETYKELKPQINPKKYKVKMARKDIRAIKDKEARKVANKKFKETMVKDLKEFLNKIGSLKARLAGIKEERQLLKLQLGKAKLRKISQDLALEKRCKVSV